MASTNRNLLCLLVISVFFNIMSVIDVRSFSPGDMVVMNKRVGAPGQTLADVYLIGDKPIPMIPLPWKARASLIREGVVYAEGGKIALFKEPDEKLSKDSL